VASSVTTLFVGGHYEVTGSQITKYYFAGSQRIAIRKYAIPQSMSVEYLLTDHLGSTSLTTDSSGVKVSEMRYRAASQRDKPCPFWVLRKGEVRYAWRTTSQTTTPAYSLTRYTFTSQYSHVDDPTTSGVTEGFGLMFYNARYYDPALGRFAQADSLIPGGAQGLDRFAYVNNSPVRYTDPSGHKCQPEDECDAKPQPKVPSGLTEDGRVMYDYYQYLKSTKYPDLTLLQFFGLMTMYEINGNPIAQKWDIESAADQLFARDHGKGTPNPYCPDSNAECIAGVYNYLGSYSESAMDHALSHNDGPPPLLADSSGDLLTDAEKIGADIMSKQGPDRPFLGIHYGNNPSWQDAARSRLSEVPGINQVLAMDGSYVAFTITQENFWMCVTDTSYGPCARSYGIDPKKKKLRRTFSYEDN